MIGEAEIIVGAHVEHTFAAGDGDVRVLRRGDDALGFVEPLRFYFIECLGKLLLKFGDHRSADYSEKKIWKPGSQEIRWNLRPSSVFLGFSLTVKSICRDVNKC